MPLLQSGSDLDGATQRSHSAEVGQSRSGLFGFCRPQKTVSPVMQQGYQDQTSSVKCHAMPCVNSSANNNKEACPEPDSGSAWSTLPEHLIETIMQMLQEDLPPTAHHNNRAAIRVH